jgi:hypothetical protein
MESDHLRRIFDSEGSSMTHPVFGAGRLLRKCIATIVPPKTPGSYTPTCDHVRWKNFPSKLPKVAYVDQWAVLYARYRTI